MIIMDAIPEKKKRGRKPKQQTSDLIDTNNKPTKKRGRKPKGGKVVTYQPELNPETPVKINVVLHLKCNSSDLNTYNESVNILDNYKFTQSSKTNDLNYTLYNVNDTSKTNKTKKIIETEDDNIKKIWTKLDILSNCLHTNNICDKKSACFYCTYEFDNNPIYIPKYELNNIYHVYGCFCSPECACGFLMNEYNIDTTTRFERYYLLNYLYCKIYSYTKNIKPAPSPFYMLEKFYGSLSIQEYRKLLKNERLLIIVDKPLIRILPELHEDTDDYLLNSHNIKSQSHYSCKQNQNNIVKSKNNIVCEQFNL